MGHEKRIKRCVSGVGVLFDNLDSMGDAGIQNTAVPRWYLRGFREDVVIHVIQRYSNHVARDLHHDGHTDLRRI